MLLLGTGLLAAGYAWWTLPRTEGSVALPGLRAEVLIERDAQGIPTIRAGSAEDAAFGLGFVHAQDRLWQLETHRRIGAGELAEAFGPPALGTDRFLRALGVRRAAEAQWAATGEPARRALEAYAAGINAFVSRELRARPPEFVLLGLQPPAWTPQDSLAWATMMAWDLGGNWRSELQRMRLALTLPVARIDELLPPYPGEAPRVTADYPSLYRSLAVDGRLGAQALRDAPASGLEGIGSNNWVLAASRTTTGGPLLANDPHLKLSAPALWYLARLEWPGNRVAGATMPGLPAVVLGQNEHVAWGYTNTGPDVQDLYLEQIDPGEPARYRTPDGWAAFETHEETIRVRGAAPVTVRVRRTRHGPVLSDAGVGEGMTGPSGRPTYALALRWTALDADPGTLEAGLGFMQARSLDEFVAASARYVAPMQNMLVADRAGRIGFVAAGRVPLRRPDNDLWGQVPAPGWEARYDWDGFLPAAATPREFDPARGWIATANQRIHAPDYPHYLGSDWAAPYRMQRIEQLIAARPRHSLDDLRAMQSDELSLATQRLLPFLRRAAPEHALAAAAMRTLQDFDGTMARGRAAPLIFWAWVRHLARRVFADELGAANWAESGRSWRSALERVLERDDAWWCDDKSTPAVEACAQQIDAALADALDELRASRGDDPAAWAWGRAHVARSEHRPFSRVGWLAPWFELRTPVGGDTYTINASRVDLKPDPRTGELYLDEHGPSLRAIYDLADPSRSRVMQSSGQSGLFFAPDYRRFVAPWAAVQDVPLWAAPTVHSLRLRPEGGPVGSDR
ncbi:MAG: penicillin acylase family protein [Piscinibacter sp.]|nr:penicillin acylase family protein [Piscinibacter sp.]